MACNKEDVSKVKLGKLSPFTVNFLRDMRDFLGVTFKLKPNDEDGTVNAACIGTGYTNTAKKMG
jgi:RNA 3'-terminal phosphate cyclase-like protein